MAAHPTRDQLEALWSGKLGNALDLSVWAINRWGEWSSLRWYELKRFERNSGDDRWCWERPFPDAVKRRHVNSGHHLLT